MNTGQIKELTEFILNNISHQLDETDNEQIKNVIESIFKDYVQTNLEKVLTDYFEHKCVILIGLKDIYQSGIENRDIELSDAQLKDIMQMLQDTQPWSFIDDAIEAFLDAATAYENFLVAHRNEINGIMKDKGSLEYAIASTLMKYERTDFFSLLCHSRNEIEDQVFKSTPKELIW